MAAEYRPTLSYCASGCQPGTYANVVVGWRPVLSDWMGTPDEWQDFDPFFLAGASAAAVALLFYLLSRRTRLTIRLEDGSTMQVAVRNKHFTLASQFANVVCRVSTHWEPRDLTPNKEPRVAPRLTKSSAASLEIEDDELDDDWESDSTSETMSAETRSSPPRHCRSNSPMMRSQGMNRMT